MKACWSARAAALLLGAGLLVLAELSLRLAGVGPSNRLFLEEGERYGLNPRAAQRFFQHQYARTAPAGEGFARSKGEKTFRIFVVGASTLLGFPNPPHTAFPDFMRPMLADAFPQRDFEVVNCGITAINSFCILDFVEEIVEREPDLLVIYAGHNEFVGPYGVTTPFIRVGNHRAWIRFHMLLQRAKIYYLVKEGLYRLRQGLRGEPQQERFGLHLVRKEVLFDSAEHRLTEENYRRNLEAILQLAAEHRLPVLLSTLVSNLRGFYPLRSQGAAARNAAAQFEQGERRYQRGDFAGARRAFVRARDLDTIRFRASSPFNRIIRREAAHFDRITLLVDLEGLFSRASPHGIAGDELIADYLHPTVFGHFLAAREMVETMVRQQRRLGLAGGETGRLAGFEAYGRRLGHTRRARVYARNDLILLLHNMPYEPPPPTLRRRLAGLVSLQLEEILKLSYAEIRAFARKGGFYFLARSLEWVDAAAQERLRAQLQEVAGPLDLDPYARPPER